MIVANHVGDGKGFNVDENAVTVITANEQFELPKATKTRIAQQLIECIAERIPSDNP